MSPSVPKPKHRAQKKRFHARRDPAYMVWIHSQSCILKGRSAVIHGLVIPHTCWLPVEGCHVRSRGAGGDDAANLYPGCRVAHTSQHLRGLKGFQALWRIDLKAEAARLYQQYLTEMGRA